MKFIFLIFSLLISLSTQAEVKKEFSTTYYQIDALDIEGVVEKVRLIGPNYKKKHAWAILNWDLSVEFTYRSNDKGCSIITDKVAVIANVELPYWKGIEHKKSQLKVWWQAFFQFIENHENQHLNNVYTNAENLDKKLSQEEYFSSCSKAKLNYLDSKKNTLEKIRRADILIDQATIRQINSNQPLFQPLKSSTGGLVIESGFMRSVIGM